MIRIKFTDFWEDNEAFKEYVLGVLRKYYNGVVESDNPDFVIYSVFGYEHLKYNCVRIMYTGENQVPDFNICDYAIGFHYIDFQDRYIRFPLYHFYQQDYELAMKKHEMSDKQLQTHDRFCNFVYSNGNAMPERQAFFELLSKYKNIDSGGGFLNNVGGPVADKREFQSHYKFSIAFENSKANGYTTEKILQAFSAGTIPIYYGNALVSKDFNEKAFINCHNYSSFEEVVEKVKEIDADDELFKKYIRQPSISKDQKDDFEELEKFLVYIFGQSPEAAYRRNNVGRGLWYQNEQKKLSNVRNVGLVNVLKSKVKQLLKK